MKRLSPVMLALSLLFPALSVTANAAYAAAADTAKPGTTSAPAGAPVRVTSVEGITEYRLANGLRVLLFPDSSKPSVTTNIVYMVGSRHENYGETGMAHLLEHLMFKPSANFGVKKGTRTPVDVLNAIGGSFNGTTWYDRTNYFASFPANDENLKLMLSLEADRMVNAAIDQNDLWNPKTQKGEMTVVRNEFESGESDPVGVTTQRMQAVAFDWHNYGKDTIGARSDIEQVNIARLRAFYKNYYQPDNALLMVAGRFDEAKVLAQINEKFGRIPKPHRVIQTTYTSEPTQDGERAVTVRRSGGIQYVGGGYHVPPSGHVDATAIALLNEILAATPSGRLHKALIETKLATELKVQAVENLDPSYRIYGAVVPKDVKLETAQDALFAVLESFKTEPVTQEELDRARQNLLKNFELVTNDTANLTIALTEALAAGDWRLFFLQRDQIEKADLASVQAAAVQYFKTSNRTLGRFIPTDAPDRSDIPPTPNIAAMVKDYHGKPAVAQGEAFDPSPANIEARLQRFALSNGMKVALLPKKTKGATVSASMLLRLGTEESLRGKAQVGGLVAALLTSGTEKMTRQELKDAFDKLKSQVTVYGEAVGVGIDVTTTRENLPATLDLVAEAVRKATFPAKEFQEQQLAWVGRVEQQMTEPQPLAGNAFERLIDPTPVGHVNHTLSFAEEVAAAKAVTVQDVKAFHAAFFGANHAGFTAVGDFDASAIKTQLEALFGNWKSVEPYVRIPRTAKPSTGEKITLETPDKANSMLIAVQQLPIKDSDANYPALVMVDRMLGGGALRSRLADRIRQKEGLSYGVGSQLQAYPLDPAGFWLAYAISAPENTAKVEAALREEMQKVIAQGFTEDELKEAKKAWRQGVEIERTQDASLARRLTTYLKIDRTMKFDQDLEAKVAALTLAQVNQAAKESLKLENLSVIVAGDFAKSAKANAKP